MSQRNKISSYIEIISIWASLIIYEEPINQDTRNKYKELIKDFIVHDKDRIISVLQWDIICDETNNDPIWELHGGIITDYIDNKIWYKSTARYNKSTEIVDVAINHNDED